jgi:hypothetical protein
MMSHKKFFVQNKITRSVRVIHTRSKRELIENYEIFQVNPPFVKVNLFDIEDCLASSDTLSFQERQELFYSKGIDYDKVFKYFNYINDLNKIYKNSDSHESKSENKEPSNFTKICVCYQLIIHWLI